MTLLSANQIAYIFRANDKNCYMLCNKEYFFFFVIKYYYASIGIVGLWYTRP